MARSLEALAITFAAMSPNAQSALRGRPKSSARPWVRLASTMNNKVSMRGWSRCGPPSGSKRSARRGRLDEELEIDRVIAEATDPDP